MHGRLSRVDAERRLKASGATEGLYLVREKEAGVSYVISIVEKQHINHYILEKVKQPDSSSPSSSSPSSGGDFFFMISSHGFMDCASVDDVIHYLAAMTEHYPDLPVLKKVCRADTF